VCTKLSKMTHNYLGECELSNLIFRVMAYGI